MPQWPHSCVCRRKLCRGEIPNLPRHVPPQGFVGPSSADAYHTCRILYSVDSDGFASLSLLNLNWYKQAQRQELYAHHLSRCPSYALCNNVITGPFRRNDLYRLKTKFAAEVRRNLFEAYMRPRRTLINLISVNANSSAAFPGGEAFRFAFSPNGQTILALSSSRIYVLDVTTDNIVVRRELKTLRRPIAASITDDGSLLAVLSSKHQVNIYGLTPEGPKHLQVLALNDPPRTIALAHEGTVLAAAYAGLVEVFSLAANALSTDRRAVRSEAMDTLQFSGDGSMLVGSSQSLEEPNAVVITAPFYTENDPDLSSREIHSRMWTTQILFPQISSVCSHAELLQGHIEGDATWLFAYDHSLMSYRAVRTDDTRTGVAYFLNPPTNRRFSLPAPSTAPTASACGTLVASGYAGSGMWLYGLPERLDASPDMGSVVERHEERMKGRVHLTTATGHIEPLMAYSPSVSGSSDEMEGLDSLAQKVDWRQSLFVKCRGVNTLEGCSAAKWVERSENRQIEFAGKRLVVVAPGGVNSFGEELGEESMPVDGSRICLLDFDYAPTPFENREITIEVGDNVPELLAEAAGDIDTEVALERRRTVRGSGGRGTAAPRGSLGRSQTAASPPAQSYLGARPRRPSVSQPSSPSEGVNTPPVKPSSVNLHRSATAGGYRAARFPPRPPLGQDYPPGSGPGQPTGPGRRPSEDSWETPPPPYSSGGPAHAPTSSPFANWPQLPNGATHNQYAPPALYPQPLRAGQGQQGNMSGPPAGYQNNAFLAPRSRGPHLATVSESAVPRPPLATVPFADPSPINPNSAAGTPTHPSPEEPHPIMAATISHPLSPPHPISPPTQQAAPPIMYAPPQLAPSQPSAGGLTLTGSNLQNRLNHPVPPTPPGTRDQHRSVSAPLSQSQAAGFGFSGPTPYQLSNLERPVSQTQRWPLNNLTNGNVHTLAPMTPPPPPGAWGATGVPGSPSFHRAIATPNGQLNRSGSRGSNVSIPTSSSTPNLHAGGRPMYDRMDTIKSEGGEQPHYPGPLRMRAHSVEEAIPSPVREQLGGLYQERRTGTDPPSFVPRPKKKKKARSEGWSGQSEAGTSQGKKRTSRCIVM